MGMRDRGPRNPLWPLNSAKYENWRPGGPLSLNSSYSALFARVRDDERLSKSRESTPWAVCTNRYMGSRSWPPAKSYR